MKKSLLFLLPALLCAGLSVCAQQLNVYPTNWYVGMKDPKVQLMVHRDKVGDATISLRAYAGVKLTKRFTPDNHNYQFLDLEIAPTTKAGDVIFDVKEPNGGRSNTFTYELRARNTANGKTRALGVSSSDLIWLVMPDRFSNGDTTNDRVAGYRDQLVDRKNKYARHGGDFQGVVGHLDYLKSWGVTTVWMTPVIENDMPLEFEGDHNMSGYHGYWFTDHYTIDKRYGGNEGYAKLIDATHSKGMKVIQDAVYNHVGIGTGS